VTVLPQISRLYTAILSASAAAQSRHNVSWLPRPVPHRPHPHPHTHMHTPLTTSSMSMICCVLPVSPPSPSRLHVPSLVVVCVLVPANIPSRALPPPSLSLCYGCSDTICSLLSPNSVPQWGAESSLAGQWLPAAGWDGPWTARTGFGPMWMCCDIFAAV